MRKTSPQDLRFQIGVLFVGTALLVLGYVIAHVLSRSAAFARLLTRVSGSDVSENAQVAASFGVGLGITALLMVIVYFMVPRKRARQR